MCTWIRMWAFVLWCREWVKHKAQRKEKLPLHVGTVTSLFFGYFRLQSAQNKSLHSIPVETLIFVNYNGQNMVICSVVCRERGRKIQFLNQPVRCLTSPYPVPELPTATAQNTGTTNHSSLTHTTGNPRYWNSSSLPEAEPFLSWKVKSWQQCPWQQIRFNHLILTPPCFRGEGRKSSTPTLNSKGHGH